MSRWRARGRRVAASAAEVQVSAGTARTWLRRCNAGGIDGLQDAPRAGRPATYTPERVGEVVAAALSKPRDLGLPSGARPLGRLEAYPHEACHLPTKRGRLDELLIAEGSRRRAQETWFGERAGLVAAAGRQAAPP